MAGDRIVFVRDGWLDGLEIVYHGDVPRPSSRPQLGFGRRPSAEKWGALPRPFALVDVPVVVFRGRCSGLHHWPAWVSTEGPTGFVLSLGPGERVRDHCDRGRC